MWFKDTQGKVNMSKTINMYLIIFSMILLGSILINSIALSKVNKKLNKIENKINENSTHCSGK